MPIFQVNKRKTRSECLSAWRKKKIGTPSLAHDTASHSNRTRLCSPEIQKKNCACSAGHWVEAPGFQTYSDHCVVSALKHSLLQVLSFKPAGVLLGTCGPPGEPGVMLREGMTYDNRGKWQYSGSLYRGWAPGRWACAHIQRFGA